jgi:hypothetical protein
VTRIFERWSSKPLGQLLAEGIGRKSAEELCTRRNWRLRATVVALRAARYEANICKDDLRIGVMSEVPWYARKATRERRKELAIRNLARWTYNLKALLEQRRRMRRNRGRQLALDWETKMPNWTDDDGVSHFGDDRTFAEKIGVVGANGAPVVDNPRHSSETFEHGTPPEVVAAARVVLGGAIDLDPASCDKANGYVLATEYMTKEDNGFVQPWWGRVFLNPPGGLMELDTGRPVFIKTKKRPSCVESGACGLPPGHSHKNVGSSSGAWWKKLAREYSECRISAGIFIGFSLEILQTTQVEAAGLPLPLDFPICYPRKRLDYIALEREGIVAGGAPTHASFIVLLPPYGAKHAPDAKIRHAAVVRFRDAFSQFGKVVG